MSVYYSGKRRKWRYEFIVQGVRFTGTWYRTKTEAKEAEAKRKEEIRNPKPTVVTPTDMDFLELVNRRLDYVKAYNSEIHYSGTLSSARQWLKEWKDLKCGEIGNEMVQEYMLKRGRVSRNAANKDLCYLRTLFNFGLKRRLISRNPTQEVSFFPTEKGIKYVPAHEDVLRVILAAEPEIQSYLWVTKETMGRIGEINRLQWSDVDFESRFIVLYTRKKRGGNLTPRKVPMTAKLYDELSMIYAKRNKEVPWVFWHRYWSRSKKEWVVGPFRFRNKLMKKLCLRAGVKHFGFHALRHLGASILDRANVNIGSIQRILGHENRRTTEIYLHSVGESERDAMKVFEDVTKNPHTNPHTPNKEGVSMVS